MGDYCQDCPAFEPFCDGSAEHTGRCRELEDGSKRSTGWPSTCHWHPSRSSILPPFFPQLLNGLEVPSVLAREPAIAVGIAKALTPRGKVSRRAIPEPYATHSLRAQWGIGERYPAHLHRQLPGPLPGAALESTAIERETSGAGFRPWASTRPPASTSPSTSTGPEWSTWSTSSAPG